MTLIYEYKDITVYECIKCLHWTRKC